jgi:uncharacterized lipoprotein YddW (UPF0748 family)
MLYADKVHPMQYEIIVRTPQNFKTDADVERFVTACGKYGIDRITLLCKQDEDDEYPSGMLFYPSQTAPVAKGYAKRDLVALLIKKAHAAHIGVRAWIPQFHDQIAFYTDSRWPMMAKGKNGVEPYVTKEGEYFVNPMNPAVQQYELSIIDDLVRRYDFDAVVLDWIRFDNYAMDLGSGTREDFNTTYGFDPLTIDFKKPGKKRDLWNRYRKEKIAAYIHLAKEHIHAIKPNLPLGVFVLSPEWDEIAQDPATFRNDIDFIAPMCYFDDWGYPPEWVYDRKREDAIVPLVHRKAGDKEIVPVFDADWKRDIYTKIFAHLEGIKSIAFFYYGRWTPSLLKRVTATKIK